MIKKIEKHRITVEFLDRETLLKAVKLLNNKYDCKITVFEDYDYSAYEVTE